MAMAAARGFLACAYVFTEDEARARVDAGVDVVVVHLGLISAGHVGARTTVSLDEAAATLERVMSAIRGRSTNADRVLSRRPLSSAADFAWIVERLPDVQGFFRCVGV
jgi:predicted TIM-barrel enzyme